MPAPVRNALLYARTLRYVRPVQIFGRVYSEGRRRMGLVRLPELPEFLRSSPLSFRVPPVTHDPWNDPESIEKGRFCFLDEMRNLGRPVRWADAGSAPLLWQFNLHYFNYLSLLTTEAQGALCREWLEHVPEGKGVGWHPFPLSLRIVNWTKAEMHDATVDEGLYRQAGYLARSLEVYHPGNHLLENARALVFAGKYFQGKGEAATWMKRGLSILQRETGRQVLSDGGHFERTPMYHSLVLWLYIDVLSILPKEHHDASPLREAIGDMADALGAMCHPDGDIALFNDSTLEIAPSPDVLLDRAVALTGHRATAMSALPEIGYYRYEDENAFLILDAGAIGPDELPAHAHAGIFSYEASIGGVRFVTDTGVFEYAAGPMRTYDRSTRAHNTLTIDGVDQAECWASFRVARRFPPRDVEVLDDEKTWRFRGEFLGYASLIGDGLSHERSVLASRIEKTIRITDRVVGEGEHLVETRIHLHPEVSIESTESGVRLEREGTVVHLTIEEGALSRAEGRYSPRFGCSIPRPVLVISASGQPPFTLAYSFRYA